MYKDSTFIALTAVFYSLMTATYFVVSFHVNHINANNENTRYVAFILITFFFGSVIKSLYAFLIDIHVDFEDELPAMYKKYKKVINGVTDIILVLLMCSFILQVSDNSLVILYIFFFCLIIFGLFIYVVFNHKKTGKLKRVKGSKKVENNEESTIHTSDLNVRKEENHER